MLFRLSTILTIALSKSPISSFLLSLSILIGIFKLIYEKLQEKIGPGYPDGEKWISTAILGKIMFREEFNQFIDECNNNDFVRFFIEYIPWYRPVEINPIEIIAKYAEEFYLFPYRY